MKLGRAVYILHMLINPMVNHNSFGTPETAAPPALEMLANLNVKVMQASDCG